MAAAALAPGETPEVMRRRTLSLRAFAADGMMVAAALAPGQDLADAVVRLLSDGRTAYLHAHYAAMGCYAARIDRAPRS